MRPRRDRPPRPPLDASALNELALAYVGRFATTRAKLRTYLSRKLRERGWAGEADPDLEALAQKYAELGYVDDKAYALARSRSLSSRGFGPARIRQSLHTAGIAPEDSAEARSLALRQSVDAALRFAERRRIGPFAVSAGDRAARERAIAALVRAGHAFALARAIVDMSPGAIPDEAELCDVAGVERN
jgi:regulatory protein